MTSAGLTLMVPPVQAPTPQIRLAGSADKALLADCGACLSDGGGCFPTTKVKLAHCERVPRLLALPSGGLSPVAGATAVVDYVVKAEAFDFTCFFPIRTFMVLRRLQKVTGRSTGWRRWLYSHDAAALRRWVGSRTASAQALRADGTFGLPFIRASPPTFSFLSSGGSLRDSSVILLVVTKLLGWLARAAQSLIEDDENQYDLPTRGRRNSPESQ